MRLSRHRAVRAFVMTAAASAASVAFMTVRAQTGVPAGQRAQPDPATSQSPTSTEAAERTARAGAEKSGVTCRTEFSRMRDGTMLATDVYQPASPGKYPVIMQRTPYGLPLGHGCWANLSGKHGVLGHERICRADAGCPWNVQIRGPVRAVLSGAAGWLRRRRVGGRAALVERPRRPHRYFILRRHPVAGGTGGAALPRRHRAWSDGH